MIEVDPLENLYTILIEESAAARLSEAYAPNEGIEGPYSNPRIEPFDLQEDE